jgi:hypothetical protein
MCPVIVVFTLLSLLFPTKKGKDVERHHSQSRLTVESFSKKTLENFLYVSNHYISKRIPFLGVFSQLTSFFSIVYLVMLVSFEISKIQTTNSALTSFNQLALESQSSS